jgi:dienelactone hydrolase
VSTRKWLAVALVALSTVAVVRLDDAQASGSKAVAAPAPVTLVGADGLTMLDVSLPSALPGADSPVVLLIPGWNVPRTMYRDVTSFLTKRGYAVAVFSHDDGLDALPSDWDAFASGALDLLVANALSPWSPLFHEIDPSRIAVVGQSLGGATAVLLASHDPRVRALVVCGPDSLDTTFLAAAAFVTAPLLTIDGSLDRVAPPAQRSAVVVANAASSDKGSIVITGGSHRNCPADYDDTFVMDSGRWVAVPIQAWPFFQWTYTWPPVPGLTPLPGAKERAIAFPYLGAWLDRYVLGSKSDPLGYTNGKAADPEVASGVLTSDFWSTAARKGP